MKIIKKILFIILAFVLSLFLLYNFYTFVSVQILKEDLPTVFGYAFLEVVSGSMEPTIQIGDMILIDTNASSYQEQDIVTFYDVEGSFVTHRILSIDGEMVQTKGDNIHNSLDEPIERKSIVGKYLFKIPGVGKILNAFKTPFTMVMIFIIGIMVCFLVSTDKEGKPILTEEEKEYQEFLNYKNQKQEKPLKTAKKIEPTTKTISKTEAKATSKKNSTSKKGNSKVSTSTSSSKKTMNSKTNVKKSTTVPKNTTTKKTSNTNKNSTTKKQSTSKKSSSKKK